MPIELWGTKRGAKYVGEAGIYFDFEVFAAEFARIAIGTELRVELTTARNLRQLAFAWVLAGKIADNSECYLDKNDAMENVPYGLKCRAGHAKAVVSPGTGEVTVKPVSLNRTVEGKLMDGEAFKHLLDRMVDVACRDIIPGMDQNRLTEEIEAMCARRERK